MKCRNGVSYHSTPDFYRLGVRSCSEKELRNNESALTIFTTLYFHLGTSRRPSHFQTTGSILPMKRSLDRHQMPPNNFFSESSGTLGRTRCCLQHFSRSIKGPGLSPLHAAFGGLKKGKQQLREWAWKLERRLPFARSRVVVRCNANAACLLPLSVVDLWLVSSREDSRGGDESAIAISATQSP